MEERGERYGKIPITAWTMPWLFKFYLP